MHLKVNIKNVRGSQMAAKITGNFTIDDHTFRFTAIAFGRIGGQNIGAKISKTSEKELESLGYNVDVNYSKVYWLMLARLCIDTQCCSPIASII